MIESTDIKLTYFNTIGVGYQWFILYEFTVANEPLFNMTDEEILGELISTRILNNQHYHLEMEGTELELKGLKGSLGRPFAFDKIGPDDFRFLESRSEFEKWLIHFRTEDWEDDGEEARVLIDRAEKEIRYRTQINSGLFHLSMHDFEEDSGQLCLPFGIFDYFELFIEIDRQNRVIRTMDFGAD